MPPKADWHTKREVAALLHCSEKHVERLAARGALQQSERKVPGKRPIAIFHPGDVAKLQQEQTAVESKPFVMPPDSSQPADEPQTALARRTTAPKTSVPPPRPMSRAARCEFAPVMQFCITVSSDAPPH